MDERLKQARELLKERDRKATIKYLNNLPDVKQIEELEKAINIYNNAPDLMPQDLQNLIKRFKEFQVLSEHEPTKLEMKFRAIATNLDLEEEDSFIQLLKELDNKSNGNLDKFTGNFNAWRENHSPNDWLERIESLLFLKEIYPVMNNISEIMNGKFQKSQSGYNQYREWMEKTFKILVDGSYPDDEELQKESIRKKIKNVDGRGLSAHRTTKRLKILFWHKFERDISIPQIKGMVIYENR